MRHTPKEPTHKFPPDSCPHIDAVIDHVKSELEVVRTINSKLRELAGDWKEYAEHLADQLSGAQDALQKMERALDDANDRIKQLESAQ
jgi:septal ring factor EnvC (AmiA/AmiB activator)